MGAPSHIMPANQITRGLACHFSRFPPLIDNLSIKLFFVRFRAPCAAFCGFWSMPHAIRVSLLRRFYLVWILPRPLSLICAPRLCCCRISSSFRHNMNTSFILLAHHNQTIASYTSCSYLYYTMKRKRICTRLKAIWQQDKMSFCQ